MKIDLEAWDLGHKSTMVEPDDDLVLSSLLGGRAGHGVSDARRREEGSAV